MTYRLDIYKDGNEYVSALSLTVCEEDKNDTLRVLLENGYDVRISKAVDVIEEDDF